MFATRFPATRQSAIVALVACSIQAAALAAPKGNALDPAAAGIPVYPGASVDAGTSAFVRESLSLTATAYRTADGLAKVSAFYEKQSGMQRVGEPTKEGAMFNAGCKDEFNAILKKNMRRCNHQVTVQNPWMDMKTGKMVNDTLITIVKQ